MVNPQPANEFIITEIDKPRDNKLALGDAAMRLAGHDGSDPEARDLARRVVAGTVSAEDAIAQVRRAAFK
ncbi:antitoxin VbhA family protein [Corynebacterium striatum]|uniref:antitoxin VbhA family protein n=1 Tax=Corynebacterium striatum TaxID=43770 RepID=UPI000627F673|nr:antitoxin VbhA family protein [Corynebacterium striatum]KKO77943.1 hypothetical protein WU85_08875 [Corynebacterium striatum]MBD0853920.1 hypothetical protein [Corynebacterium striatum]MBD0856943.1 hypothetical protein [Corynebacterium striatum]MDK8844874.1 antitoxin VbhA family protein [Corynebacterium striatum]PIS59179.1 hypothetical protein AZH44_06520 [Corynebacterium striatum]